MNPQDILPLIGHHKVVAIVRDLDPRAALESAKSVIAAGLPIVEVSLTTPDAFAIIHELASTTQGVIGAGTVLDVGDVDRVVAAGAQFIVTPNLNPSVITAALDHGLLVGPGVFTATESFEALALGSHLLKLFPAASAGIPLMKSLSDPFPGALWLPTGGITPSNFMEWLEAGAFAVGMGSALTKGNPEEISERAGRILSSLANSSSPENS
jgi:2-dehydro-3-deoxyphosphogluconate aldolase/(4S)-4-hydroxy-2-oxoglutarate aldolase